MIHLELLGTLIHHVSIKDGFMMFVALDKTMVDCKRQTQTKQYIVAFGNTSCSHRQGPLLRHFMTRGIPIKESY